MEIAMNVKVTVRVRQETTGRCLAWCPELPGCRVAGATREHTLHQMDLAIRAYLASLDAVDPDVIESQLAEC
jgi:predicted RNase H-like HicB family nuclease